MAGYATLIKYALWALLIAACLGAIWYGVHEIQDHGKQLERLQCNKEIAALNTAKAEQDAAMAKELGESMKRVAAANEKQYQDLIGVLDDKKKSYDNLKKRFDSDIAANRGLWITAPVPTPSGCPNPLPGAVDPGEESGAAKNYRLPREVEDFLWNFAYDA